MSMILQVRQWLEKQGFSLEMRAASAFRALNFEVRQSSYYSEAWTGHTREMDVEATCASPLGLVDVRFFVECKSSGKPWVSLCSRDTLTNYNRILAFGALSKQSQKIFTDENRFPNLLQNFSWLKKNGVVAAYSLRQAFSGDVDTVYAAAMSVCNACESHVTDTRTKSKYLNFAFPVIVVDTPLIRCVLNAKGEIALDEVEQGEFLFTGHQLRTCIRVVTLAHLPAFAREAKEVAWQLQRELNSDEKRIVDDYERQAKNRGV